jgi:ABC-type amino acid transport substrate-binding protein
MQDISINEEIEIRLNFVRETEAKALVNEGICDGYFSAMPKTFSSEKQYYFSTPLFNSGYLIVVMNDSPLKNLEDCIDANIGVTRDSLNRILPFLRPSWRAYIYDTTSLALEDVKQRRINGVLIDSLDLQILLTGRYSNEFRPLYPSLSPHEIRVVTLKTPKGAELIGSIDKGSSRLKEKGLIEKHLQYWGITSLNNLSAVK